MIFDRQLTSALPAAIVLALYAAAAGPGAAGAAETPAKDAADAGAALGVDLYRLLCAQDGNILFSPYSISEALALLSCGADGRTRQEVLKTLHWTRTADQIPGAFGAQHLQLDAASRDGAILSVADSIWYQRGHEPRAAFLRAARQEFRAEVRLADFSADLPVSLRMINSWVEKNTGGKIPGLLPPDALTPRTSLVLANAIYFKGRWERPFDEHATAPGRFFTTPGKSVMTATMARTAQFRTWSADACELLELPYAGGELSMVILLPRTRDGLPSLERQLGFAALSQWLASLDAARPEEMAVTLPRFGITYAAELNKDLSQLGMVAAFMRDEANLSRINGGRDLFVSTMLHKAFVDVNEEGTEAAAATSAVLTSFSVQAPRKLPVDHPFLFLIRDTSTGSLLFLGRIVDPRPM